MKKMNRLKRLRELVIKGREYYKLSSERLTEKEFVRNYVTMRMNYDSRQVDGSKTHSDVGLIKQNVGSSHSRSIPADTSCLGGVRWNQL